MIFVTGDTLSPGARQFLSGTRCDSLDKPLSKDDLLDKVAAVLVVRHRCGRPPRAAARGGADSFAVRVGASSP